jgi:hypothetical protein
VLYGPKLCRDEVVIASGLVTLAIEEFNDLSEKVLDGRCRFDENEKRCQTAIATDMISSLIFLK